MTSERRRSGISAPKGWTPAEFEIGARSRDSARVQLGFSPLSATNDMIVGEWRSWERRSGRGHSLRSWSMSCSTTAPTSASRRSMDVAAYLAACSAAAIVFVQLLSATFASAQSPTNAVKEFGLFGIWAGDCNANPSPANQYASFSVTSRGTIHLRNEFGPDYGDMVYRIVDAKRINQFQISLRQLLMTDDQVALDTVMLKAKDRIRIWSSRGADGSEYVQDGLVPAANNHETGWMERCDTRRAGDLSTVPVELRSQIGSHAQAQIGP
jgi:hypothetical protein